MKCLFSLILTLCAAVHCSAQQYALTLNLQKDSVYYLNTYGNVTITQTLNGTPQLSKILISAKAAHKVTDIKDTVYHMQVYYLDMKLNMDINGRMMNIDPADKERNVMGRVMSGMINKPFNMTISKAGRVLDIEGLDVIFISMFDNVEGLNDEQKAQIRAQMENSYGAKQLKNNFQEAFPMLPAGKITTADKWVAVTALEQPASVKINTTFQLKEVTEKYYVIHGDADLSLNTISKDYRSSAGIPMRVIKLAGTNNSDIRLDRKTGWIADVKNTRNVDMTMEIQDSPKVPGGMIIPMVVGSTVTLSGR